MSLCSEGKGDMSTSWQHLGTMMRIIHSVAEDTDPFSSTWDGKKPSCNLMEVLQGKASTHHSESMWDSGDQLPTYSKLINCIFPDIFSTANVFCLSCLLSESSYLNNCNNIKQSLHTHKEKKSNSVNFRKWLQWSVSKGLIISFIFFSLERRDNFHMLVGTTSISATLHTKLQLI